MELSVSNIGEALKKWFNKSIILVNGLNFNDTKVFT
jgi:hypothetical protein